MTTATMTTAETMSPKVAPVVIDRNRDVVTGRFAPKAAKWGITTVRLANGRIGYQLGGQGVIFANRQSAVSRALAVRPSIVHTGPIIRLVGRIAPKVVAPIKPARVARTFAEGIEVEAVEAVEVNSFEWASAVSCLWEFANERQQNVAQMILMNDWASIKSYVMVAPAGPTIAEMKAAKLAKRTV